MLEFLKKKAEMTYTENGAVTNATTGKDCLDLFATIGALRRESNEEILARFARAFAEDPDMAMKTVFFARDVRGGLGERRVFRIILRDLATTHASTVRKNMPYIAEFGRWDDLVELLDTPCEAEALALIREQLSEDVAANERGESISLLAKWLPSVNTSNKETVRKAKKIARALGFTDAQYRKTLVALRKKLAILENNLREKDYTFDYTKQPSKAMLKYRAAFDRNDKERYQAFLDNVSKGNANMNTGTLAPYEIVRPFFDRNVQEDEARALEVTWNALEDFSGKEDALVVMDGSGSMYGNWGGRTGTKPITVAMSLAMYFAERNKGAFRGHFITFSMSPQLVEIKGKTLADKLQYCSTFNEVANTDLQRVFELLLDTAVSNNMSREDMPKKLYIVSDMEFDTCMCNASATNFEQAKSLFNEMGYELPEIVFWNVESRNRQQPVRYNEQGVALVSGCTPRLFEMTAGGNLNPYAFMLETLGSERYAVICA